MLRLFVGRADASLKCMIDVTELEKTVLKSRQSGQRQPISLKPTRLVFTSLLIFARWLEQILISQQTFCLWTLNLPYWRIGNENWGDGGNMRPEFYADLYLMFSNTVRRFSEGKGTRNGIEIFAGGANAADYDWTHNTFENPDNVTINEITINTTKAFSLPRASVVSMIF